MHSSRIFAVLFFVLYVSACASPTIQHVVPVRGPAPNSARPGYVALMLGWIPPVTIPWSANALVLAGWLLRGYRGYAVTLRLGIAAFLLSLTAWFLFSYDATRIGLYLWQASFIAFILWAYAASVEAQGREQKPDPMTDLA
jgi:hypothetical protein